MNADSQAEATPMLTVPETCALLTRVDTLLETLGYRLARVRIGGKLNDKQSANLTFSADVVEGLRTLFREERERLAVLDVSERGAARDVEPRNGSDTKSLPMVKE